ncbi:MULTISPECIES: DUF2848 domain-containing protein [Pantoea]|jgi:hypothetical protein|uniref:DUF2848 domain-containing protein n=1 Tax=Pantoea TaxID=53335 RepID=UPI0024131697|nr:MULTISPECIES: DUF2848 domain-containing protein [Pantoea]MDR6350103.1 hypothetical protein [Pantoea sp. SORGH_AS_0659]WFL65962.1 DUF2848 domain-containing protein [Pantoea sp. X85]WGK55742.1 DUF2848 domain-containing protein [Pantoea sp. SS70]
MQLRFTTDYADAAVLDVEINQLVIAGWVGRDQEAVLHHIRELEALGVPAPGAVPLFYRVATNQLTQETQLEVVGDQTSGEAEPFVFFHRGEYWVSLISDHTDRHLETFSVALSKQACIKPVAGHAWRMTDVKAHWDQLELRAWINVNGDWVTYQQGALSSLLTPLDLLSRYFAAGQVEEGFAMSCGTLSAIGGIRPSSEFRMALHDPVLNRTLEHTYITGSLPVIA